MAEGDQTIPRKGLSEPSYAVHRPISSEAGPSNEIRIDATQPDHRSHTPPPYSGPASPRSVSQTPQNQVSYPGLPKLDYRLYLPPSFKLSEDKRTITSYDGVLNTQRTALLTLIQKLAYIPPKPQVRITGTSNGDVDFDIKLNIMNLIIPEGEKQRMNYIKTIPDGEIGHRGKTKQTAGPCLEGLEQWVRNYCEDDASIKHFALDRTIINWDTTHLSGLLLTLLKSISYHGNVNITFPLTHSRVLIHSPDKINHFFSNVTKVFTGSHRYEPVKSIWPYANVPRGEEGRKCVVQDEDTWFREWKDAIGNAVRCKRRGWVTVEDRLEFLMEPKGLGETGKQGEWGTS